MFLAFLINLSLANKQICICDDDCKSICYADTYYNSSSKTEIDYFFLSSLKNEKELDLQFYSSKKGFTFSIDSRKFETKNVTIRVHESSEPIKFYIKLKTKFFHKKIEIKPNYKIILPYLTPILTSNKHARKILLDSPNQTPIPVSVGMVSFNHEGSITCCGPTDESSKCHSIDYNWKNVDYGCNADDVTSPESNNCGLRCYTSNGKIWYTFTGVKYAVYGTYKNNHGEFDLYLDGSFVERINTCRENMQKYSHMYESPNLVYGTHTVEFRGIGNAFEVSKLVYWPSHTAKRINSTQFTMNGDWIKESDGVGGVRHYKNSGALAGVTLKCTKFWIIGARASYLPDVDIYFNDVHRSLPVRADKRDEGFILFESDEFEYKEMTVRFIPQNQNETLMIYTIYYEEPLEPQPTPVPISVSLRQMERGGSLTCTNHNNKEIDFSTEIKDYDCSNDLSSRDAYQCGIRCWGTDMKFNYTFKGVKFSLYGKYDVDFGSFYIKVDGAQLVEIYPRSAPMPYSVLYESDQLEYREHKVMIYPKENGLYEVYKLTYWPSMTAKRLNSTDFTKSTTFLSEQDYIGGIREFTNTNGATATISVNCTKFWLYGVTDSYHGQMSIKFGNIERTIDQTTNPRVEGALLYESPDLEHFNNAITLTRKTNYMMICFIYFEEPPIPISVGLLQMIHDRNDTRCIFKNGYEIYFSPSINIDDLNCNSDLNSADSYKCGLSCWNKYGSFIYKFKGVKFSLYGTYDPIHQAIDVELDGIKIAQVNEAGTRKEYMLIYESDVYNYREHTVRISATNQLYELYKLAYWPSLHSERKNASEFIVSDSFNWKSDGIGGFYIQNNNQNTKSVSISVRTTKFRLYGVTDQSLGPLTLTYNGVTTTVSQQSDTRVIGALLYESPDMRETTITVTLSAQSGTMNFYCMYYDKAPPPQSTPVPMSVSLVNMNPTGLNECGYYTKSDSFQYNTELPGTQNRGCDIDNIELPGAYQCGVRCWSSRANYTYKFKGVKFAVYGTYNSGHGEFEVWFDGALIKTVSENVPGKSGLGMLYESDTYIYREHNIEIRSKNQMYEFYKITYWLSLKARRVNSTDFQRITTAWNKESDGIGGFWQYSEGGGGKMFKSMLCSRVWLFGSKQDNFGNIEVKYDNVTQNVNQYTSEGREDIVLHLDSNEFAFKYINLTWMSVTSATTLFYTAYYHEDPAITEYIDKQFNTTLPYFQIWVTPSSTVHQISGCTFHDISEDFEYFITLEKETYLLDNVFLYEDPPNKKPAPINIRYGGRFVMKNCTFEKAINRDSNEKHGNVVYCGLYDINALFESCSFTNCGNSKRKAIIQFEYPGSRIEMNHCNFSFTESGRTPSKAIDTYSTNVIINECIFVKTCAVVLRYRDDVFRENETNDLSDEINITRSIFDGLENDESDEGSCLHIEIGSSKLTIENNVIRNTRDLDNTYGYLKINFKKEAHDLELKNIEFTDNVCLCLYGGGSGVFIQQASSLYFYNCSFTNNQARQNTINPRSAHKSGLGSTYLSGDGGGIQLGFECKTNEATVKFESCKFVRNKAFRHGGAIAIQTQNTVEIIDCTFDSNEAFASFTNLSELLEYENHFHKKSEGRGGAIYINPSYSYDVFGTRCFDENAHMTSVKITSSIFTNNSAYDGFAIYIEGDDPGTTFDIRENTFTKNYNYGQSASSDTSITVRGDIATEIHTVTRDVETENTFEHEYRYKKLVYIDHYGVILPTYAFSESIYFSDSQGFTQSAQFSPLDAFSESKVFSKTRAFSESNDFSPSDQFTQSSQFSPSDAFSESKAFSKTRSFSESNDFSPSDLFSQSSQFSPSDAFSESNDFSPSDQFTQTAQFSPSDAFSESKAFSKTSAFSKFNERSSSDQFTQSSQFSPSDAFSESKAFSKTSAFSKFNEYLSTDAFSRSKIFSKTSAFSESNDFSSSYQFTHSIQFTLSDALSSANDFYSFSISEIHESEHSCSGESLVSGLSFTLENYESDKSFYHFSDIYDYTSVNSRTNDSINPSHFSSSKESISSDNQFLLSSLFSVSEHMLFSNIQQIREKGTKLSTGAIVGILIGCILVALIVSLIIWLFLRKRKKNLSEESIQQANTETKTATDDKPNIYNFVPTNSEDEDINFWI